MQAWYLLYCKRGQLQRAQEHLERQSVNCLMPTIALEKIIRGKRTMVSEPLFPNYLFIEFDPEVIHTTTISATRGVNNFVRFGALPAIVPSAVIHQLSIYKPEGITDPETPHEGDSVLITDGAFEGLEAIFTEPGIFSSQGLSSVRNRSWASRQCKNTGIDSSAASANWALNATSCSCGVEKFRLKSRPHSPIATTCGSPARV